jgi:hypothetical protein
VFAIALAGRYLWAWWPEASGDGALAHWFKRGAFVGRTYLYLVVWVGIAMMYYRASHKQDEGTASNVRSFAAPLGVLSLIVASAFGADWVFGLDIEHFELSHAPLLGLVVALDGLMSALAILTIFATLARPTGVFGKLLDDAMLRRVGRWLAAAALASAAARVPLALSSEVWRAHWYTGSWRIVAGVHGAAIVVGAIAAMIPRGAVAGAACLLFASLLGAYQLVMPAFQESAMPSWTVLGAFGGAVTMLWLPLVMRASEDRWYPVNDPLLK